LVNGDKHNNYKNQKEAQLQNKRERKQKSKKK